MWQGTERSRYWPLGRSSSIRHPLLVEFILGSFSSTVPGCRWKTIFPGPDCKPFQISVESEAVKIKGKYLSKDVTTLNFNNKLSANLSWNTRTAVTPLCIFNFPKDKFGRQRFFCPWFSVCFLSVDWGCLCKFSKWQYFFAYYESCKSLPKIY